MALSVTIGTTPLDVNATLYKGYHAAITIPYTVTSGSVNLSSSTALLTISDPGTGSDVTDAGTAGGIFVWTPTSATEATAAITIPAATSAAWTPGSYCWQIEVTQSDTTTKHLFLTGLLIVTEKAC